MSRDVAKYYQSLWGKPSRVLDYRGSGARLQVHTWGIADTDMGVALYATVGASEGKAAGDHRVEFILGLDPPQDGVISSLASLGAFPILAGEIDKGETVTLGEPLWPGSEMRAFLMVPEVEDFIPPLVTRRKHVQFLRALPVYDSEIDLKNKHGAGWLMDQLFDQDLGIADPERRPVTEATQVQ
ncbi:suppressor of fused domain protein [Actinoplanes sp. NPDC049118]|uniref:suppressor of fused domain protein n=1 Tax=Actinoplanes sp. NPDC049118 TaxID=3155769 RepID=UPI0033FF5662